MDIKQYIDRFDEISHLERDKQFSLLDQARDHIESKSPMYQFSTITLLVRIVAIFVLVGGSFLIWDFSGWVLFISFFLALIVSRIAISEINEHLIIKGLKAVLHNSNV